MERPITIDEACALKLLLFGSTEDTFGNAWTDQSFNFRSVPPYGFLQKTAGPCGVLAAVQGYVINELFYGDPPIITNSEQMRIRSANKKNALSLALASILWQAGDKYSAIVCAKQDNVALNTDEATVILKQDCILEFVHLLYFECKDCLIEYLAESEMMKDGSSACILLLYSVILSRGIEKIKKEMDDPGSRLIGEDGYCSQEVVNLLLTGKAVSNLFDGDIELNSGGSETTFHHGIPEKSNIGLLSWYDYHDTSPVGKNYKEPANPVWVLVGESHYTVLFAKGDRNFEKDDNFTLYHYDGLAKQHAETAFFIEPNDKSSSSPKDKNLPVVVQCIYTRWPLAKIREKDRHEDD